jgi:hypothetical protein
LYKDTSILEEYTSTLKMEAVCFSEQLISTYKSTKRYYLEEQHRHHCPKNFKSEKEAPPHCQYDKH